jgi:hypothetical protein
MPTSSRRQMKRLALGANKKIKVHVAECQVTVGVMRMRNVKVPSSGTVKAREGAEKSCLRRRRKRGQRVGKRRSRVGKTRRSVPTRPSNPKPPTSPSKHFSRCYVWVLKSLNDLFRKKIEKRLDVFERIWHPRRGRPVEYTASDIVAYRKCRSYYRKIQSTAKRAHLENYPELRLGRNFWEYIEKRRPSDLGGLLGAIGVRPKSDGVATGFGKNPDGSFVFGRSTPANLPRDPSGLRRPDTSVVRSGLERKRAKQINASRSARSSGPTATVCCSIGYTGSHKRDCPSLKQASRGSRP